MKRTILRVLFFPAMLWIGFIITFFIIRLMAGAGQISFTTENITRINNLRSAQTNVFFVDDHEFPSTKMYITGRSWLTSEFFEISALDMNGKMRNVDSVFFVPEDNDQHEICISHIGERVDYEALFSSSDVDYNLKNYEVELSYHTKTAKDYAYKITAPYVYMGVFYLPNDRIHNTEQEDYISIRSDCTMMGVIEGEDPDLDEAFEIRSFDILASTEVDKNFDEEWTSTQFQIGSNGSITFSLAPFTEKQSDFDKTVINVFYPVSFDGVLTGDLTWRQGTTTKEFKLKDERLAFRLNESDVDQNMMEVKNAGLIIYDEDSFYVDYEHIHPVTLAFETKSIDGKRITQIPEYTTSVIGASLNGVDLFPNLKTYLIDNWSTALIATLLLAAFGYYREMRKRQA